MYFQCRGETYSFIYYDVSLKKNIRLRSSEIPKIRSDEEANAFCRRWEAKHDGLKTRIQRRLQWEEKFHEFSKLLNIYERMRKESAPNSWQMDCYNLKYYAFPFFLDLKAENNVHLWHVYFEEFREHLETVRPLKQKKKGMPLAYATMNNVIKSLNAFLLCLYRRREVDQIWKCRYFSKSKLNRKGEEAVISEEDQAKIYGGLRTLCPAAADMFLISLHTGMRLNELLGLSLADFFEDLPTTEPLRLALKPFALKAFGFISLESQPKNIQKPKDEEGLVPRKPLKGKHRIDPEDARTIPILSKDAYNTLVRRWNLQQILFERRLYGRDPKNYLLLDGLNKNFYSSMLRKVQKDLQMSHLYTPHDTRHTYSTWLAEKTGGNYTLCRTILGHSSLEITLRYIHMSARLRKNLRSQLQLERSMKFVG